MVSAAQMQDQKQLKMRAKYTLQNFATCLHFTLQMFRCMNLHWLLELTTTPSSWFSVTIFTYCYILKQHETCILYNIIYIIKNTFLRTWCRPIGTFILYMSKCCPLLLFKIRVQSPSSHNSMGKSARISRCFHINFNIVNCLSRNRGKLFLPFQKAEVNLHSSKGNAKSTIRNRARMWKASFFRKHFEW